MPETNTFASPYYENLQFNVNTATTDYDVAANVSGWGDNFAPSTEGKQGYATKLSIRTDNTISVKLNASTEDAITIASTDSPMELSGIEIRNIFITNTSGNTAAVKILKTL